MHGIGSDTCTPLARKHQVNRTQMQLGRCASPPVHESPAARHRSEGCQRA